nr:reverse transcriptase domain-containing protein [Tanacetum cinerariifolium]
MIMDQVPTESTIRVPPSIIQSPPAPVSFEITHPHTPSSELPKRNPHQPPIPYHSRLNKEKLQDKSDIQIHKFLQMFKKLHFNISLAEALALIPKYHKMLKYILYDKEKLLGLANTSLTENWSAVLLKKLLEKLGDPGKFLIPCDFSKLKKCMELANFSTTPLSDSLPSLTLFETSDSLLEEFANEIALFDPFLTGNKDDNFDPEADLRKIEYLLNQDPSTKSDIKIIDPILERFTYEPALIYSPPLGDEDDDLFDLNDSTLHEESSESSEIATLSSSSFRIKDKVFNPRILMLGGTRIFNDESKDKDLKDKDLILEERNSLPISSDQELLSHLELSVTETLLSFSLENEYKVFNSEILTSKGVYSLTLGLSHQTYETFKFVNVHLNIFNKGPMKIFLFFCFCPKDKGFRGESG